MVTFKQLRKTDTQMKDIHALLRFNLNKKILFVHISLVSSTVPGVELVLY